MKLSLVILLLLFSAGPIYSQELYVFTEPASNMPSKSISFKFTGRYPQRDDGVFKQRYMPEIMFGINKKVMVHLSSTLSNYYQRKMMFEGAKAYVKYRFLSIDDVHKHFRMAAFADAGFTRNPFIFMDANLDGDNDGVQAGLIATQLVNKVAVSATVSYLNIFTEGKLRHPQHSYNIINYSVSAGYLLFPKEYVDYNQTNVNFYLELLGMKGMDKSNYSVDLAPAIQFIFKSNTKVNIGYRFQTSGNMIRVAKQVWQVSLERTILNAWK